MEIRVTVEEPSEEFSRRDLIVSSEPGATLRDLAWVLAAEWPAARLIDGGAVAIDVDGDAASPGDLLEDVVRNGSIVRLRTPTTTRPLLSEPRDASDSPRFELAVVGGLRAGETHRLRVRSQRNDSTAERSTSIGRTTSCDVVLDDAAVSARHAAIDITQRHGVSSDDLWRTESVSVRDLGSSNGTFVDEIHVREPTIIAPDHVIRVGATELAVRPSDRSDRPVGLGRSGRAVFNRPPRMIAAEVVQAIEPPSAAPEPPARPPFRSATVIIPLVFAAVLVTITGQVLFGLFALMSPVMIVTNWLSDRRSNRRAYSDSVSKHRADVTRFSVELQLCADATRRHLRASVPDAAEVQRRAHLPSRRLWERRREHGDAFTLRIGTAAVPWEAPLTGRPAPHALDAARILAEQAALEAAPVIVRIEAGSVLGLAGDPNAVHALARSLIAQLVVLHGPADLRLVIAADDAADAWGWVKWLPHARDEEWAAGLAVLVGSDDLTEFTRSAAARIQRHHGLGKQAGPRGPLTVLLVDRHDDRGVGAALATVAREPRADLAAIVLSRSVDTLPAACTAVAAFADGAPRSEPVLARFDEPASGRSQANVLVSGVSLENAEAVARSLARFDDPETSQPGAGLPDRVSLRALAGFAANDHDDDAQSLGREIATAWSTRVADARPAAPIAMGTNGPLVLDLLRDGPHGLIGGTTGSGKSELLRSLIVSFAVACSPSELTFVLIDYKGGSAFDACARLPHVVGLLTDLDVAGSQRAVRSLEAELRHRERILRRTGVSDRDSYAVKGSTEGPLPRLMVVVDEFAALKSELPDFIDALVDVAQRGRSLGVHLLLATQRPAGIVSDLIRANTDYKIALRVQDVADSVDVISSPHAAELSRTRPGRALIRIGGDEPQAVQCAYSGHRLRTARQAPVRVRPFGWPTANDQTGNLGSDAASDPGTIPGDDIEASNTELELLVDATVAAHAWLGSPLPRRPWAEPLPRALSLDALESMIDDIEHDDVAHDDVEPAIGIVDDPDAQCRHVLAWRRSRGNLAVVGLPSAGTGAVLTTLAVSLARTFEPEALHMYGFTSGVGQLGAVRALPHCGDVVASHDRERVSRLIRFLATTVRERTAAPDATRPQIVVLIENLLALKADLEDPTVSSGPFDVLQRVLTDGPAVGLHAAVAVDRPAVLTGPLGAIAEQRWVFDLQDRLDYSVFGLRPSDVGVLGPQRCVVVGSGLHAQVATGTLDDALHSVPARPRQGPANPPTASRPARLGVTPASVTLSSLHPAATTRTGSRPWSLPVGIADDDLSTACLSMHAGEHLLVSGSSRSGRTTHLAVIAACIAAAGGQVLVVGPARSPLASLVPFAESFRPSEITRLRAAVDAHLRPTGQLDADGSVLADAVAPLAVLIDDAELVDDDGGFLATLASSEHPALLLAAAVRAELLRTNYGHWTRQLRRSRLAVLLRPGDADAELTGYALPRRPLPSVPGRGYRAIAGVLDVVQFALADVDLAGDESSSRAKNT